MGISLYQLTGELATLRDIAADADGDTLVTALEQLQAQWQDKAIACLKVARELEAEATGYDAEIQRMTEARDRLRKRAGALRTYVHLEMEIAGVTEVKGDVIGAKLQNNPPSVKADMTLLPSNFTRATIKLPGHEVPEDLAKQATYEADKQLIAAELKAGATVPGAELVQTKRLVVR